MSAAETGTGLFSRRFVAGEPIPISPHEAVHNDLPGEQCHTARLCPAGRHGNAEGGVVHDVHSAGIVAIAMCTLCDFKEPVRLDGDGNILTPASRFKTDW